MASNQDIPTRLLGAVRRRLRPLRYAAKRAAGRQLRVHIENRWRLGDEVLAIPFYELVAAAYPGAILTVSVNFPELLRDNPFVVVDNERTEFACDRFIFAKDDARDTPRLEHLCATHGIPYRPIEPRVNPPDTAALPQPMPCSDLMVACSCGAGWPCKSWPTHYMKALCENIQRTDPNAVFVEVGKDCPTAGLDTSYVDKLTIAETAHVLSRCHLYIGPDSGLAHLAMAVGTPALVLYGPVVPAAAFGPRKRLFSLLAPVACQGCWTQSRMQTPGKCPLGIEADQAEAYPCMSKLTPECVFDAISHNQLLAGAG